MSAPRRSRAEAGSVAGAAPVAEAGAPPEPADLRLLVPAGLAWGVDVLLLGRGPGPAAVVALLGLLVGGAIGVLAARGRVVAPAARTVALAGLVLALVLGAAAARSAIEAAGPVEELAASGATVTIAGRVESDPRVLEAGEDRGAPRVVARLRAHEVRARGDSTRVDVGIVVLGGAQLSGMRWHERVLVSGRLRPTEPGEAEKALLIVRGEPVRIDEAGPVGRVAETVRSRFREAVHPLPADPRGLVPALVIGDRSLTPPELTDDMRATGMTHLSAVSGSNVAIVLGAAMLASAALRIPRRARPVVGGLTLAAFVVLARPDPSVLRAATMGAIGLLGFGTSRRAIGLPALAGAVVVLLVVDPWLARSYGFALSTLATLGLLLFARPWGALLAAHLPRRLHPLADATAIPLAAQVMCAPVVVLLQGSVSVVGVLANLCAAPLVAPATVAGVAAALVAAVAVTPGTLLAWVAALPAWGIALVARTLADVPFGTMPWPDGTPGALLLAGLTVILLLCAPWLVSRARRHPRLAVVIVVVAIAFAAPVGSGGPPPGSWRFAACDVGEGDATAISTGPGAAVLVDVGEEPGRTDDCLRRLGVVRLDAVVLTHYHADHAGGLAGVGDRPVGALYVGPLEEPAPNRADVVAWARNRGVAPQIVVAGTRLRWGDVEALARWPTHIVREGSAPNNSGIVLDVTAPDLRLLLLADIEKEAGRSLVADLRRDPGVRFDVVKVAHHGSANEDPALYPLLAAPLAVISVGAENDYGHPAPATLTALQRSGARIVRTDESGDVVVGRSPDGLTVGTSR